MLFSPFSQEMSMHHTTIRLCTAADASVLGELVYALIHELKPDTPITVADFIQRATQALAHPAYAAYLMLQDQDIVGFISLNECCSTYAGGAFGEITEFYVRPQFRSRQYGEQLLSHAKAIAHSKNWRELEVGAPAFPRWSRTIAFYKNNGFKEIGPRLSLNLSNP